MLQAQGAASAKVMTRWEGAASSTVGEQSRRGVRCV